MKTLGTITTLSNALHTALAGRGLDRKMREQEIFIRWPEIVGTAVANNATPTRIHRGILWIRVQDAVWRQELSGMRMEVIRKINTALNDDIVKELRLR